MEKIFILIETEYWKGDLQCTYVSEAYSSEEGAEGALNKWARSKEIQGYDVVGNDRVKTATCGKFYYTMGIKEMWVN